MPVQLGSVCSIETHARWPSVLFILTSLLCHPICQLIMDIVKANEGIMMYCFLRFCCRVESIAYIEDQIYLNRKDSFL